MHKVSIGLDVIGFAGKLTYKRAPSIPNYTLKITRVNPDPAEGITDDYIDQPSLNDIVIAGVKAEQVGKKQLELSVTAARDVSETDVRKKIEDIIKDGKDYKEQVFNKLPYQENTGLMVGLGLSGGYHYHLPLVILNVRAGLDYMCGKFKQSELYSASSAKLGWGLKTGVGIDYKLTEKATFGFEGGVRFSAFNNSDDAQACSAKWFLAPYLQGVCGFNPHPDYGVSVFFGCFLPSTFTVDASGGAILTAAKCKIEGLFGGIRMVKRF